MFYRKMNCLKLPFILIIVFLFSCDLTEPNKKDGFGQLVLKVRLLQQQNSLSKINKTASLDSVRCIVFLNKNQVLSTFLEKQESQFQAEIKLNAVSGYRLLLYGKKGDLVAYRGEKENISITAGKTTSVSIVFFDFQVKLILPENNSFTNDNTLTFSWSAVKDGNRYLLQIDDDENFSSPVLTTENITAESYTLSETLPDGEYYWRIQAIDSMGVDGVWSETWSFTIDIQAPPAPNLVSPVDSSIINDNTPAFMWNEISDAEIYHIQVDNNKDFSSPVLEQSSLDSSFYISNIALPDNMYYWKVRARDKVGNWSNWSNVLILVVDTKAPSIPVLTSPPNGSTINNNTPTIDWSDVIGAIMYHLQVDKQSDFTSPVIDLASLTISSYTPSTAIIDGQYYYRVRTKDHADNWGNWSSVWSFTIDTHGPVTPDLLFPIFTGVINDNTPTFDWSDLNDAIIYELIVDDNSRFSSPFIHQSDLSNSQYTVTSSISDGTYFWKVRAKDRAGNLGSWSKIYPFVIDTQGPSSPILISPPSGSLINENTPIFDWSDVNDAILYELVVDNGSDFNSPEILQFKLTISKYNTLISLSDGTYYWRVRARDIAGNWGDWSSTWSFKIKASGLPAPTLIRPRFNSIQTDAGGISFHWSSVEGGVVYNLQYGYNKSNFFGDKFTNSTWYDTYTFAGDNIRVYWRVRARTSDGIWGLWSDVWQFVVRGTKYMHTVSEGEFIMGSNDASDEIPIHKVYLDNFNIDRNEVTNHNYAEFLNYLLDDGVIQIVENDVKMQGTLLCRLKDIEFRDGVFSVSPEISGLPVHIVTWFGADKYAKFFGKRLPTEAEWEKACRGTDGRKYPWGNEEPDISRCNHNFLFDYYTPVRYFSPLGDNPFGCSDMAGNAMEWVADWYDAKYYSDSSALRNPEGPASGNEKVCRGGSYQDPPNNVRSAKRFHYLPDYPGNGFRCVW